LILAALALWTCAGCQQKRTMLDAFPPGGTASPWVLTGDVWNGTFEQSREGIGAEAEQWAKHAPKRVWLANYSHDTRPRDRLTVRILQFESPDAARAAYDLFEPVGPERRAFDAGDRGCWTADGVLFVWGRVVFDIFGNGTAFGAIPEQAAYLAGFLERRVTAEFLH
jgi:hypothetical protein